MDYKSLNRGMGLELLLCASDTPTEVVAIIYEKIANGFIYIPGGPYEIGSPEREVDRCSDERLHSITLSPFEIMEAAVTQEQYAAIMGHNPSLFKGEQFRDRPVETVSFDDAKKYADKLSERDSKYEYRLPTEAELEVAFRSGKKTAYVSGDYATELGIYKWYDNNSNGQTHPVKSRRPNDYGIFLSSVWEWTADWYDRYYVGSDGLNPTGPASGSDRVVRGGSWGNDAHRCRSACRSCARPGSRNGNLGFRLVRTIK